MKPETKAKLDEAIALVFADALATVNLGRTPEETKRSTTALREILTELRSATEPAVKAIWSMLAQAQNRCLHVGAVTGHNERDGFWMAPCPTCGLQR